MDFSACDRLSANPSTWLCSRRKDTETTVIGSCLNHQSLAAQILVVVIDAEFVALQLKGFFLTDRR